MRRAWPLFGLFALSGFAGLVYESIWTRYLGLLLGHAALAQTLVLAIFMGGMAGGAWICSRRGSRTRRPLAAYALVELVVGIAALGFHHLFIVAQQLVYSVLAPGLGDGLTASLVRWAVAASLILPQSLLLGATFPLMTAALVRREPQKSGLVLGTAYFANSSGAAVGAVASAFLIVGRFGLPLGMVFAGAISIAVAAGAALVARRDGELQAPTLPSIRLPGTAPSRLIAAAAFLTGAASFLYEIAWIRLLSLVLGSTQHAFELMLSAFIAGLAVGGLLIRHSLDRVANPRRLAGWVQIAMAAAAVLTLPLYGAAFESMGFLVRNLARNDSGYTVFQIASHGIALSVMLPATVLAGMTLPLFTVMLMRRGAGESAIGRIYSANTLGAIAGVLVGVHVLMTSVGARGLLIVGAGVDALLGLVLLAGAGPRVRRQTAFAAAGISGILLLAVFGFRLDPSRLASGVYRHGQPFLEPNNEVVFARDGKTATVHLIARDDGVLRIATNGKPDAQIRVGPGPPVPDEVTMTLLAAVPLALHPAARDVANVGMGSGMTTHVLLGSPRLHRVDTVEIEPAMIEAARGFGAAVDRAFSDPRSRFHVRDAKTFFASRHARYDVIVSEPSNPWVSGVSGLFSREFYRTARSQLRPQGLLVQWLQLYETDLDLVASVFKALALNFTDYAVFHADNANLVIVATDNGNVGVLSPHIFEDGELGRALARIGIHDVADLELRRLGSRRSLQALFDRRPIRPNSDFAPVLAHLSPRARFLGTTAVELTRLHVAPVPVIEMLDGGVQRSEAPIAVGPHFAPAAARARAQELIRTLVFADDAPRMAGREVQRMAGSFMELRDDVCEGLLREEQPMIDALLALAVATNPYVRGESLDRMWASIHCEGLPPISELWRRLHAAVAARDAVQMSELARGLLEADPARWRDPEIEYLLTAGLCGAIVSGDVGAARAFAHAAGFHGADGDEAPIHLRLLLDHLEG